MQLLTFVYPIATHVYCKLPKVKAARSSRNYFENDITHYGQPIRCHVYHRCTAFPPTAPSQNFLIEHNIKIVINGIILNLLFRSQQTYIALGLRSLNKTTRCSWHRNWRGQKLFLALDNKDIASRKPCKASRLNSPSTIWASFSVSRRATVRLKCKML